MEITTRQDASLVVGARGVVGSYIVEHLLLRGRNTFALSRAPQPSTSVRWFRGDLKRPDTLNFPEFETLYCTTDATLVAECLPQLINPSLRRVVVFSSTSVLTKYDSEVSAERENIRKLVDAERSIVLACEGHGVEWTILRPTLIYAEGRDTNITPMSNLIRRYGFMLLVGGARGLRQPVHAEDLAIGAIIAASRGAAANKIYSLSGGETLTYREMVGRIFDGLRMPRRTISVPPFLWKAAFACAKPLWPGSNVAMGLRMMKDMAFDSTPAARDFDWNPRTFNPVFDLHQTIR
ncbi:epimerase [Bradyrhizobium sp. KBS0727]|nr:epimerase [Bradyrhizobium sp. KBS0725]QDW46384.1 epimerase [Bradyrhizobium sp. KBS0727]